MLRIVENLGEFVYESVPEHTILKCRITRNRKGVDKGSHKFYALQLKLVRRPTKMRTLKQDFVVCVKDRGTELVSYKRSEGRGRL